MKKDFNKEVRIEELKGGGGGVYDNSLKDTRRKKNLLTFGELTHSMS